MSDFHELIKSFPKIREYVRDFFVYGFKTRNDFKDKSPRTYDNQRRRLESWLAPYVRKDYAQGGFNLSLAIDSNLLDTNPLFQVWKTKSFTDNDVILHFFILDLLQDGKMLSAEEITDRLLTDYGTLPDVQTVRRKCNAYAREGLLHRQKCKKSVLFFLDNTLTDWLKAHENIADMLSFFQMAGNFGIVANELSEHLDCQNRTFRVKHSFFVHTLEEEILFEVLDAMHKKKALKLEIKSSKRDMVTTSVCVPLQIFTSARSGRRFLCGYLDNSKRFSCFRLDTIKKASPLETAEGYDELLDKLMRNQPQLWGVSFQGLERHHSDKITMTIWALEPTENYIADRLKREGRGGVVTKIARNTYQYEIEVFDCNEMLPWIRTFIGRILSFQCTAKTVEKRFYADLQTMYHMYGVEEDCAIADASPKSP